MAVKSRFEGPLLRKCSILLRQASFLALEEPVSFPTGQAEKDTIECSTLVEGSHKAPFGEIEERGAAVTAKERGSPETVDALMTDGFQKFPDDWDDLMNQGSIYFQFQIAKEPKERPILRKGNQTLPEQLITEGVVEVFPITYKDFCPSRLPASFNQI
ncbi:hypothetical protein BDV23DRAFT_179269 [Aspergillus alliaceus]|uniref:2-oxoadipate dioxygenase/decarboxylase n=1 Tax=Petromyces alliaceus TaxID=209559 RepID=A0A5N7CN06_PETAA|nr:hypothetical protein BDV23DRAFT_179269 [Aspergillus alliaceus]